MISGFAVRVLAGNQNPGIQVSDSRHLCFSLHLAWDGLLLCFFFFFFFLSFDGIRPEQNNWHLVVIFNFILLNRKYCILCGVKLHWNLFLRVELIRNLLWFQWWFGSKEARSHNLNQWWLNLLYITRPHCVHRLILCKLWYLQYTNVEDTYFLHAKPWIPGGEKSIFTVVIHQWRSPLYQFACARTIDEYYVTMPVTCVRMMSQINCSDVTMLIRKDYL